MQNWLPFLPSALANCERNERILGAVSWCAKCDVAHEINELAKPQFVEARVSAVFWLVTLERGVVALDRAHVVIDELADGLLRRH